MDLLCPVCGAPLRRTERTFCCENRHSYDLARSGYVNLLPPSPAGKRHGDDRRMVQARTEFLARGWYSHLEQAVAELAVELSPAPARVIDAGCGEGAYTRRIYQALTAAGKAPQLTGIDISTEALRRAARCVPEGVFCAASTAHMPLADSAADLIANIFSPFLPEEFRRVLAPGGHVIRVYPLARHLWELKACIYDTPYENPPLPLEAGGFTLIREAALHRVIELPTQQDVQNLFRMTPYYYKTGAADQQKLDAVQQLAVTTEFGIAVYRKNA